MKKKIQKKFFLFEIIPSELVAPNCLYQEENTWNRHTVCWETALRFTISVTETFCRTTNFPVIKKCGKGAVLQM